VAAAEHPAPESSRDGRVMRLAKQGTVILGLISGTVGLLFLLFPGIRPGQGSSPVDRSVHIGGMVVNGHTTRGQFLDYADRSKLGFTKQQLAVPGASVFARIQFVGYRGKALMLESQIVDAAGNVVGEARDFAVTPSVERDSRRWGEWTPLRRGVGSYAMVIKVLDENGTSAIDCGQSGTFGGLDGVSSGTPPQLCEQG
jgi:hypothetical protein